MQRSSVKEARESLLGAITDVKVFLSVPCPSVSFELLLRVSQSYLTAIACFRGEARPV